MKYLLYTLFIPFLWSVAGCAGPLQVEYTPPPPETQIKGAGTIFIAPYEDTRGTDNPRYLGTISSPVVGLHGDKLIIEGEVAALVTEAMKRELAVAGFHVIDWMTGKEAHDWKGYLLSGRVKQFALTIGPRDEIAIEVENRLVDRESGEVLWEKSFAVKDDRYAGVMGNSRKTIGLYISNTLSRVVRESVAELIANLPTPGPSSSQEVTGEEKESIIRRGDGRLVITTEPSRSKVYIGDVYYGLTPLEVAIEPGVHSVTLRHKDYQTVRERVSVRSGDVTEMEVELERVD